MSDWIINAPRNRRFVECIQSGRHQEAWDYIMVWAWMVAGDVPAHAVRRAFCHAGGIDEGLKRCPRMLFGTIRVFVGNHLKQLSNRLWDKYPAWDEPSLWRLVDALGRSNMDCELSASARHDGNMRAKERKRRKANTAEVQAYSEFVEKTNILSNRGARRAGYR